MRPNAKGPDIAHVTLIARIAVFVGCVLPFLGVLSHGFIAVDDQMHTYLNPFLNGRAPGGIWMFWTSAYGGLYIPVTYTVWGILASAARLDAPDEFGIALNPWLFHAASVIVHVGSVLLVFRILRQLTGREGASFAGALLFAIHPLQTETVAWASGLKDLLCGFFALLAIWKLPAWLVVALTAAGGLGLSLLARLGGAA